MMRSLWTAASGMTSQQQNIDVISNNLANVNTTGYKKERLEFKTLLYDTIQRADLDAGNSPSRPVNLQVGLGVRPAATARIFTIGNMAKTDVKTDFAIEGDGFFQVRYGANDTDVGYTRDGSFKLSATADGLMLVTTEGYPILGVDGDVIIIPEDAQVQSINVDERGVFSVVNADKETVDLGLQLNLVQFSNPQGLEAKGANLLLETAASGAPVLESEGNTPTLSNVRQGILEMSNVQVAEEMVNLIVAQRGYELSSKAIQASDEMLQQANNLRR